MSKLQEIEAEYEKLPEDDMLKIIEFFETESDYLLSDDIKDISDIQCIYIDYLFALYSEARYTKAIKFADTLENIDSVIKYSDLDKKFKTDLIFFKSASLFNKSLFSEAKQGFKILTQLDSENEDFIDWYNDSKHRMVQKYNNLILYISIGLAFLTLFLRHYFSIPIPKEFQYLFEGIFILSFGFIYIYRFIIRRKPTANNV